MIYSRCAACPQSKPPLIRGDGPAPCRIAFIGEQPGKDETTGGRPFIGKAGKEMNEHYLPLAGLDRDHVYFSNTVKCMHATSGEAPPDETIRICSEHNLKRELEMVKPQIVVPMGAVACSLIEGGVDLEMEYGIDRRAKILGKEYTVVPQWHPALGMHKGSMIQQLREGFQNLGRVVKGKTVVVKDEYAGRYCGELFHHYQVVDVLKNPYNDIAIDTESYPDENGDYRPWCLSFSIRYDEGWMIHVSSQGGLQAFLEKLRDWKGIIYLHNGIHDIPVLENMYIKLPWRRVRDTMLQAHHRGDKPRSLKRAAFRIFGVRMQEFEDLVMPYSWQVMMNYLGEASTHKYVRPEKTLRGGKPYHAHAPHTKLKSLMTTLAKRNVAGKTDEETDLFFRFYEQWTAYDREQIQGVMGPAPRMSITHVPREKAIVYACTDAIMTLRYGHWLKRQKVRI